MAKKSKSRARKPQVPAPPPAQSGGVNIGGDSRVDVQGDIVGRDKITQIVVQFWPVLVALAVVVVLGAGAYWLFYVPEKMSGGFKVAVAQFGRLDANGNVQPSDDGGKLSKFIYDQLKIEFDALAQDPAIKQDFNPQLWHDSMGPFQKRASIGLIPDKSPEKEKALAELAKRINADVIVYGNLTTQQNAANFEPQFYIPPSVQKEADEITGETQLGTPVTIALPIDLDSSGARRSLNRNLALRSYALAQFTIGVLYDSFGDNDKAYHIFTEAEKRLTDWDDSQGKEVLYYFIGREAWSLANGHKNLTRVFKSADEALQVAKQALERAAAINPQYARTHIGLGNVYFLRAQRGLAPERTGTAEFAAALKDVDAALNEYQLVVNSNAQATEPQTYLKAQLSLGNAFSLKGHALVLQGDMDGAFTLFEQAIQLMQTGLRALEPSQVRLLAQTYLNLGIAYQEQAHTQNVQNQNQRGRAQYEQAGNYYRLCSELARSDGARSDAYVQDIAAKFCGPYAKTVDQIVKDLQAGK